MINRKFHPGQSVRITEKAADLVPEYVGRMGTVHRLIDPPTQSDQERYYVRIHNENGAEILVRLPVECIEVPPPDNRPRFPGKDLQDEQGERTGPDT